MTTVDPDRRVNVGRLVAQLVEAEPGVAPWDLAQRALDLIPPHQYRHCLGQVLPLAIKRAMAGRAATLAKVGGPNTESVSHGQSLLDEMVCTSPGKWKRLRECHTGNLAKMARFRRSLARQNERWSQVYESLRAALQATDSASVGDLAPSYVEASFGEERPQ